MDPNALKTAVVLLLSHITSPSLADSELRRNQNLLIDLIAEANNATRIPKISTTRSTSEPVGDAAGEHLSPAARDDGGGARLPRTPAVHDGAGKPAPRVRFLGNTR